MVEGSREHLDVEEKLRQANESLEERVRERTAELQMAVENLEQEIEERRQAETRGADAESRLRLAVQATGVGFWELDLETRRAYVSDEWRGTLGYAPGDPDEAYDTWAALFHPDDRERAEKTVADAVAAGASVIEIEIRVLHRDGRYRSVLSRASVVPQGEARPRILGVSLDISERKRTEEALLRAAKDESLAVLAGGVAHDFNNLLVAMLGHASLAAAKLPPESPARLHVEKVVGAAERASELTRQMLAYSGKGHFEVRPLDLNRLVEENLHFLAAGVPKAVTLLPRLSDELPAVEADLGQIQQVVMNLVLNAAEAIGDRSGQVVVRTGVLDLASDTGGYSRLTGVPLLPGRYALLEVQDDGRGMDAATLPRIFDPFFTTKFTGRGLGLAAVLGIVRGHQGGLSVYSEPGRGTTFKVLFPAKGGAKAAPPPRLELGRSEGLVLLVEDEAMVRDTAQAILESLGFEVRAAASGVAALDLYRKEKHLIRCVLLDLSMPGMGGLETFKLLRTLDPEVSVVLCSGYDESEATRDFVGHGLAGFVQKPYDAASLGEAIQRNLRPATTPAPD